MRNTTTLTEDAVLKWMRQRIADGQYDTPASLAREFLDEHNIHDVLDPAFSCVMDVGFRLAPEMAQLDASDSGSQN